MRNTKKTKLDTSRVYDISKLPIFPECIIMQSEKTHITAEPMGFSIEDDRIFRNWILLMHDKEEGRVTILSSFSIPAAKSESTEDLFEEHGILLSTAHKALQNIVDTIIEKQFEKSNKSNNKRNLH